MGAGQLGGRIIEPEWLDRVPADDPAALRSRRDLRRINAWMGHAGLIARCLQRHGNGPAPRRVADLGAGDGALLAAVARRLAPRWKNLEVVLVDRHPRVEGAHHAALAALGWHSTAVTADAVEWLETQPSTDGTVFVANLFLHHFDDRQLRRLLGLIARRGCLLVACEPARTRRALVGARLLPFIGCSALTRHDARASVRAGFVGQELSALWPRAGVSDLTEGPANLFTHLFVARRRS